MIGDGDDSDYDRMTINSEAIQYRTDYGVAPCWSREALRYF